MKIKVQVTVQSDEGQAEVVHEVAGLSLGHRLLQPGQNGSRLRQGKPERVRHKGPRSRRTTSWIISALPASDFTVIWTLISMPLFTSAPILPW
jgi:hypothetical protein